MNCLENLKPKATSKSQGLQCSLYFNCINRALGSYPYQTARYVAYICHSSVKYLQNICKKVSVTYLRHIGIWPCNISVTVMWQISVTVKVICDRHLSQLCDRYLSHICNIQEFGPITYPSQLCDSIVSLQIKLSVYYLPSRYVA